MKARLPDQSTKIQVLQWINSTLNTTETKIQSFGNGIVYCLMINHFIPNSIPKNKIILVPMNQMDNKTNLRRFQQALQLNNIKSITFDIFRVSQNSYLDNWQLINKLYKYFKDSKFDTKQTEKVVQINENHAVNNNLILHNNRMNFNQNLVTQKDISKTLDFGTGLLTPMKGLKFFDENTKLKVQALRLMEQIKMIVKSQSQSDRAKVKNLKKMLGLIQQENHEQELDMKELFSDCKKKQEFITID